MRLIRRAGALPYDLLLRVLLAAAASVCSAPAQASPTVASQIGVEIVFPRDDTYHPADPFPVVFAFTGASAAWTYGFEFEFQTRRSDGCEGECGVVASGQFGVDEGAFGAGGGVSFGDDDAYYLVTTATGMGSGESYNGGYTLEWAFGFERNCSTEDGGQIVQSTGSVTSARGSTQFSIQRDANPDVRTQLLDNCPLAGGGVAIAADLSGCPELGANANTDPCALNVPEDVVARVVSGLAATGGDSPVASSSSAPLAPPMPTSTGLTAFSTLAMSTTGSSSSTSVQASMTTTTTSSSGTSSANATPTATAVNAAGGFAPLGFAAFWTSLFIVVWEY